MSAARAFTARVLDAGGGHVALVVDRDTRDYPPVGASVRVEVAWTPEGDALLKALEAVYSGASASEAAALHDRLEDLGYRVVRS